MQTRRIPFLRVGWLLAVLLAATGIQPALAQVPEWIWHRYQGALPKGTEVIYVRKEFAIPGAVTAAELKVCGDDEATVFLNGRQVMVARSKANPQAANYSATSADVTKDVAAGRNVIAASVRNGGGPSGVIMKLELTLGDGQKHVLISDATWLTSLELKPGWEKAEFIPTGWAPAVSIAKEGDNPWFEVMTPPSTATELELLPGFKAEMIRKARPGEGSWIAMTIDSKGRLIISPQQLLGTNGGGLLRITLGNTGRIQREERISLPIGGAQGLLYAHDSLYVDGYYEAQTPDTLGFYRVRDTNGDDQYDDVQLLKRLYNRGGSHGPHGITLGPDGMLYHVGGDYSRPVDGISPGSPYQNYAEDILLPREWDASGHARGITAPMGTVQRTDSQGKQWEVVAGGLRNPYDLAFNPEGELFTFDADMEYDIGLPWYRPTRVYHIVTGGEYGHREGTGKWPYYYPDSLPPVTDIGLSSPCGVKFGTGSHFPGRYGTAMYLADWAWGHIYAVHMKPNGASFTATYEKFASGRPLNAMDIEFGKDGAMYFITGGNDTQSALYRISYTGDRVPEPRKTEAQFREEVRSRELRSLRRSLEAFQGKRIASAIGIAWPSLDHPDRAIRYAARMAIEWQEPRLWKYRALGETRPQAALASLLALARVGTAEDLPDLLKALDRISWNTLDESQRLELLRIYGVAFSRQGGAPQKGRRELIAKFDALYPATSDALNRELCMLLVYLEAPSVVPKTMPLLGSAGTQEQQIHYIFCLRNVVHGWTPQTRQAYFEWFNLAAGKFRGGVSFFKFLANFKRDAMSTLTPAEKERLAPLLKDEVAPPVKTVAPRPFVKEWKLEELLPQLGETASGRSFAKGRAAFEAAQCILCHRFGQEGGLVGPDLTAVAARFSPRDILEAVIAPSKVVMEQYQNTTVIKKNGDSVSGRIVDETDAQLVVLTNPLTLERVEIRKADVQSRRPSALSPMPEGLVNVLTRDDIFDLVAYLQSGGSPTHPVFKK